MIGYGIFGKVDELILELIYVEEKSIEEKVILDTLLNTENFGEWVFNDPSFFGYFERRNALNFYYKWKIMVDRKELKNIHNTFVGSLTHTNRERLFYLDDNVDTNAEHIPKNITTIERRDGFYRYVVPQPKVDIPKMQGIINIATLENKKPRIEILRLKKSKSISLKNIDWKQLANSVFEKYRKKSKGDGL